MCARVEVETDDSKGRVDLLPRARIELAFIEVIIRLPDEPTSVLAGPESGVCLLNRQRTPRDALDVLQPRDGKLADQDWLGGVQMVQAHKGVVRIPKRARGHAKGIAGIELYLVQGQRAERVAAGGDQGTVRVPLERRDFPVAGAPTLALLRTGLHLERSAQKCTREPAANATGHTVDKAPDLVQAHQLVGYECEEVLLTAYEKVSLI